MSNLSQHPAAAPLRDRNSPEPSKLPNTAVLREAAPNAGWQPSPPSTSPLRISKRSPSPSPTLVSSNVSKTLVPKLPGKIPARRNSSSYRHMHSNNLVSKSPFKTLIPSAPSSSTSASRPIQIPQRRVSGEKRPRPMSMYEPADNENERPYTTKRERKQSKGFRGLNELEPVTKSPFRRAQFLGNGADPVTEKPLPSVPKQQQAVHSGSPVRSSLVSKRLHGPRSTSISKRPRRKTVTFHEECDVVEFDVEEPFDDDDEQGPYTDSEGDYEDVDEEMGHTGEEHEPEHDHEYDHDAYEHSNQHPIDHEHGHTEIPTAAVQGNEDRGIQGPMTASPPLPEPPHTPPLDVAPVPDQEMEDGVPYGRTHHAERARQFHQEQAAEHYGTPPLPPPPPPQEPPRRRSIDALGPLPPIPTGDGVGMRTPPIAGSPSAVTSTPPLGRSTHAERARAEHTAHAFDEDVRQLPPSPSPHKPSPPVLPNGMGPRLSLDVDSAITSHDSHDAFDERELSFNSIRSHPSFNSLRSAASASGASSPHDAGSPSLDGVSISAFEAEIAHVVSGSARSSIDESYNDNDIDDDDDDGGGGFANHQGLRHSTPPPPPPPPIPIPRSRSASPYGSRENSPVPGRFHSPRVSSPLAAPENNCTPPPPPRTTFSPQQQPSPTSGRMRITREDMQQRLIHRRSVEEALGASASVGNSTSSNSNVPSGFGSQGQMHSRVSSDSLISGPSNHSGLGHGRSSGIGSDKFVRTLSLDVSSSSLGLDGSFDATDADGDVSMGNINVSAEYATIEQVERRSMNAPLPLPPIPGGGIVAAITPGVVLFPAGGSKGRTGSNASLPPLPVVHPQPRPALTSSASADHAIVGLGSVADIVPPIRPSIRPRAHTMPRTDADDSMSVAVGIGGGGLASPGAGGMDVDMRSALDRLMDDVASVASGHADLEEEQEPEQEQEQEQVQQEREDEDEQEEEQQQQRHRRRRDRRRYSRGPGVEEEDEAEAEEEEEEEEEEGQVGQEHVRAASVSLMEVETTMTTDPETSLRVEVITDGVKAGHFDMLPTHVQRHEREDEEMMDDDRGEDRPDQRDDGKEEGEEEEPESEPPYRRETEDSPEPAPAPVVEHEESDDEHAEEEYVQDPDDTVMTEDAEEEQEEEEKEDAPMKLDHRSPVSERRGLHARAATDTELLVSKPQPPLPTTPSITIDFAPLDIGESISGTSFPAVGTSSSASFSRPLPPPVPAPAPPARDAIKDRHQLIIEKRREARRREEAAMGLPSKRTGRRRSMSTGDAEGVRAKQASTARPDSPGLDVDGIDDGEALGESINRELQKLGVTKKKYQVRERRETIYASSDAAMGHLGSAGDVSSSKAWKAVKRPSDMNEYAKQIKEFRAQEKPGKGHGKVFVKVVGVKLDLPLPPQPTIMTCTLNNGIHYVTTPECNLTSEAKINQEFELIEHSKLEFTLTLKVRRDPHIMAQFKALQPPPAPQTLAPPPTRVVQAPPQRSGMRRFFSSSPKPKDPPKNAAPPPRQSAPPPVHRMPDNLARYLKQDGMLARAFIAFKDVASHCDTRLFETSYPLIGQRLEQGGGVKSMQVGEIILQMFRLPPLPGVPQHELPQSLEECHRGLRHVAWHKVTYFEGILTQNGGDCLTWRRRQLRVIGANLVAFNDVTKRATASIDIRKAIAVEDDQDRGRALSPISTRSQALDDYDGIFGVERSFRLIFPHNQEIVFFADTDEEKSRWLEVLRALVGHIPPNPFWAELVWQKQHDIARQQQQQQQQQTPSSSSSLLLEPQQSQS